MTRRLDDLSGWTPATFPPREPIMGERVRLEPLDIERHTEALWMAAQGPGSDSALWDYLSYGPFATIEEFRDYVAGKAADPEPFFAIIDRATGEARGIASYLRIYPTAGTIEIGHIWLGTGLQRTTAATEAIFLLMRRAFELGNRRLEWKCNAANARSMAAAERFGFTFEGTFRQHLIVKGRNRDTAWFSIIDAEWPPIRAAFERWLDAANFDRQGQQRLRLADLLPRR